MNRTWILTPLLLLLPSLGGCQWHNAGGEASQAIMLKQTETDGPLILHVRSDAFDQGDEIPLRYTAYGENISPVLAWSGAPDTEKSQVVVVEDPDAGPTPFVHWIVYGIPAGVTRLPANIPPGPRVSDPAGAMQGVNSKGATAYFGPRPPKDDPAHHFHFQVFALDTPLHLSPGASRQDLLKVMNGHVVAKGELVGTYRER